VKPGAALNPKTPRIKPDKPNEPAAAKHWEIYQTVEILRDRYLPESDE
jgi:hypothetical protein